MFDKVKFAHIIKNIKETYNSQEEFSKKSEIGRTYLSQYMNMKLDNPPKPNILKKLANSSNGIINYNELMEICGYTDISLDIAFLEDLYSEVENQYLDKLCEIKLNPKEYEVYDSLLNIFPYKNAHQMSPTEISKATNSYLDTIDWINEKSKNKIIKKIELFIEYFINTSQINKEIEDKKICESIKCFSSAHNKKLDSPIPFNKYYMCPVYGRISAGQPNWAEECIEGRIPIDPDYMNITEPTECFFLKVNGESMNKEIKNGAYALIRKTDFVENGEIAVVLVNGYDATLKKFSQQGDLVILEPMSNDPSFTTQVYGKDTEIKIIGKYIGKMEMK